VKKNIVTISDNAALQIKKLLDSRGKPSVGIKVKVEKGGCSGLKYKIEYADSVDKFDEIIEENGVKLIIDAKAVLHLIGTEMDFIEEQFKSGFVFINPNEKSRCGCGESFSV